MAEVKLSNSLSHQKEPLVAEAGRVLTMYSCGPTVYGRAHIGNLRAYVFADVLRRGLEYSGHKVRQVMNLTDVDDKTIRNSRQAGVSLNDYTAPFIVSFLADIEALNIQKPAALPRAIEYIPQMVQIIETLLKKGVAYTGDDGSVYFSIAKFPEYGRLTNVGGRELQAGASGRVLADEYDKESVADFALWKAWGEEDGDVFWETSLGKGRPGWHIECSAMSMAELTPAFGAGSFVPEAFETIDIHTGGVDNMFPHHEDEIAQSEAATGKEFARFFVHNEHLLVDGQKMAKSLGNFYTLADITEKGFSPLDYRFLLMQAHYRQKLNFTWDSLKAAREARLSLAEFLAEQAAGTEALTEALAKRLGEVKKEADAALFDDLGTPAALAALLGLKREINKASIKSPQVAAFYTEYEPVFGLGWDKLESKSAETADIPASVQNLANKREAARQAKDYALSDALRTQIEAAGYTVEDTSTGPRLKPNV